LEAVVAGGLYPSPAAFTNLSISSEFVSGTALAAGFASVFLRVTGG